MPQWSCVIGKRETVILDKEAVDRSDDAPFALSQLFVLPRKFSSFLLYSTLKNINVDLYSHSRTHNRPFNIRHCPSSSSTAFIRLFTQIYASLLIIVQIMSISSNSFLFPSNPPISIQIQRDLSTRFTYAHFFARNDMESHLVQRVFSPEGVQYHIDPHFAGGAFVDFISMSRAIWLILFPNSPEGYANPDSPRNFILQNQLPVGIAGLPLGLPAPMINDMDENFIHVRGSLDQVNEVWNRVQEISLSSFYFLAKLHEKYGEDKAELWDRILTPKSFAEELYLLLPRFDPVRATITERIINSPEMMAGLENNPYSRPSSALQDLIDIYHSPINGYDVASALANLSIDKGVNSEPITPVMNPTPLPEEVHYFLPPFFDDDDSSRPYSPTDPLFMPHTSSSAVEEFFKEPATIGDIMESHASISELLHQLKDELIAQGLNINTQFIEEDDKEDSVDNEALSVATCFSVNSVYLPSLFDPRLHNLIIDNEGNSSAYDRDPGSTYRVRTPFPTIRSSGSQFNVDDEGFIFTSPRFI